VENSILQGTPYYNPSGTAIAGIGNLPLDQLSFTSLFFNNTNTNSSSGNICSYYCSLRFIKDMIVGFIQSSIDAAAQHALTVAVNSAAVALTVLIPGMGTAIQFVIAFASLLFTISMLGFDIVLSRKQQEYKDQQTGKTSSLSAMYWWLHRYYTIVKHLVLLMGVGLGLIVVVLSPAILLFYPVLIYSTTELYVHLEVHDQIPAAATTTGNNKQNKSA